MTTRPGPGPALLRLALQRAGRVRFRARGASMGACLRDGDVVSVVPVDPAGLRVGEVVCYEWPPGRLAVHRLVGRDGADLVTKGDALAWVCRIHPGRLLGRVTRIERPRRRDRLRAWLTRAARRLRRPRSMLRHG